ncbi:hypothetical protein H6G89_21115 [Oscillatoria sp. FACHB-1407]|uniref:calcium-binding protein n=1 Tax=Oscillatoria sp. FACHB-1407 TaxID=2692847 RepID=UPI001684EDD9|nr:calcium-binding protein [Oscillatoria sp. FACHB-1407]MBD2463508.1 hypothetical protein [Oscillatoria sp. FACHB-1407]
MARGVRLRGSNLRDIFRGTNLRDVYFGEGGNDLLSGGAGRDNCNGGSGNDRIDGGADGDTITGGAGDDRLIGGTGNDSIDGGAGNDRISGGSGDDSINASSGNDRIDAGAGNDNINGGSGNDIIRARDGNDVITGGTGIDTISGDAGNDIINAGIGDDRMLGGSGDDLMGWRDGEGSDLMTGGDGTDTVAVEGALTRGDNFTLGKDAQGQVLLDRPTIDGQAVGQFTLTVSTSEIFNVNGVGGNDTFVVNDLSNTGVTSIVFNGGEGNDSLDARNTAIRIVADGGNGDDLLAGGTGTIQIPVGTGTATVGDSLTGGGGRDRFLFANDPFTGANPGAGLNRPDLITDYEIGQDQIALNRQTSGLTNLSFQRGDASQLTGDNNLVVLTDATGFANAGAAARAIADNSNFTGGRGLFVYFNTSLGISRVVFSEDLANNGRFSVLANLTNLTNVANQSSFTAADFSLA